MPAILTASARSLDAVPRRNPVNSVDDVPWSMLLELLQLADSALPVGAAAHSFGLETLVEEGVIHPENLERFLQVHVEEAGRVEAVFLRRAWRGNDPQALCAEFGARRPSRESREATLKMGRRFCDLVRNVAGITMPSPLHYPIAFGLAGATLGIAEESVVLAYLQQSITGLISASQRLMPLGQIAASRMIWNLHPFVHKVASSSESLEVSCFNPLPELASMRHSSLETRLFIS
jgi:urease accessory protein